MPPENTYNSPGIYIEPGPSFQPCIPSLPSNIPVFIGTTGSVNNQMQKTKITSLLEYNEAFGDTGELNVHMKLYFENGGADCFVVNVGQDNTNLLNCVNALKPDDNCTLLVVPQMSSLGKQQYAELAKAMLSSCAIALNRFAILDVPGGADYSIDTINNHRQLVGNENLKYGASYLPFLIVPGSTQPVAPSAAIAGIICQTDRTKGIWKAPANVAVKGITDVSAKIDNVQQEFLNVDPATGKSINVIRYFPGKGHLVWAARTLAGNDNEWRYIPVRRFYMWVKACVSTGLGHFVFEPNEQKTWTAARGLVENFLTTLWKEGALQGTTPKEAFFVRAGLGQTMNQQDVNDGRLIVEVGLAILRPAEFTMMHIVQPVSIS